MKTTIEGRLLKLAALYLILFAIILTASPAVRERSWDVSYRWPHWLGLGAWSIMAWLVHKQVSLRLPDRDPYILPAGFLLTGWGLLTIWRLIPDFGLRQTIWMVGILSLFTLGLRLPPDLKIIRQYKYLFLTSGLALTALTLIFGSNPTGLGPRLWLGCCGVYFQPSEPLKLLLVAYLAAYLADRFPARNRIIPYLFPTAFVTGLALLLILVQRDLGTASIFILLYSATLFAASGKRRVLVVSAAILLIAGLTGYWLIDLIRLRVDAWLNPWADPSGRAYQIVQSLLSIANGGLVGRGPGLGSPLLVPIAHSDFIFTAITEETGLIGVVGLLGVYALLISRGMHIALNASDRFRRLMSVGVTSYLIIQSVLIIGGNLRLLPLTGVTLPFVSYGGTSLFTSFAALLILLLISSQADNEPAPLPNPQPFYTLSGVAFFSFFAIALGTGWWAVVRGPDLLTRTDNPRRAISDRFVLRGSLVDRDNEPISITTGETGSYRRTYMQPNLAPLIGYTHPIYGQAGLEASLDDYLRGFRGNPTSLIWWHNLLYGTPPPGLDVRLSLDQDLQEHADQLLGANTGAIILMNARNGEILVLASHPTYDPNNLDQISEQLIQNPESPLLNRVTQGQYPPEPALAPFILAWYGNHRVLNEGDKAALYQSIGFNTAPLLRIPVSPPSANASDMRVSPLQMALAAATFSNEGNQPAPRLALAVNTPQQGWVVLPALVETENIFPASQAHAAAEVYAVANKPYWDYLGSETGDKPMTWYLAGTLPGWGGTPLTLVIVVEKNAPTIALEIGRQLLESALKP